MQQTDRPFFGATPLSFAHPHPHTYTFQLFNQIRTNLTTIVRTKMRVLRGISLRHYSGGLDKFTFCPALLITEKP